MKGVSKFPLKGLKEATERLSQALCNLGTPKNQTKEFIKAMSKKNKKLSKKELLKISKGYLETIQRQETEIEAMTDIQRQKENKLNDRIFDLASKVRKLQLGFRNHVVLMADLIKA